MLSGGTGGNSDVLVLIIMLPEMALRILVVRVVVMQAVALVMTEQ